MNHYAQHKYQSEHIYVMYSRRKDMFKVGITTNPHSRSKNINSQGLACTSDWEYIGCHKVGAPDAFNHEQKIARLLNQYNLPLVEYSSPSKAPSREVYRCGLGQVMNAFKEVTGIVLDNRPKAIGTKKFMVVVDPCTSISQLTPMALRCHELGVPLSAIIKQLNQYG